MNELLNRLLIILNEGKVESTYYHISKKLISIFNSLGEFSISKVAAICNVSKSTISKFCRDIGYEDYSAFKEATKYYSVNNNKLNFNNNIINYLENHSLEEYTKSIVNQINLISKKLNMKNIDELAKDIYHYDNVAAFGLLFSQSSAVDLQIKLAYQQKNIFTHSSDLLQDKYIRNAKEDTLIIIFSNSGNYLSKYQMVEGNRKKSLFEETKAKIVLITSNSEMINNKLVDLCINFQHSNTVQIHSFAFQIISDMIALQYKLYKEEKQRRA